MSLFSANNLPSSPAAKPPANYQALDSLAVASVVLGCLSILTALHWSFMLLPLVGAALGWASQRRILQAPAEWSGLQVARTGIGLSIGLWLLGSGIYFTAESREAYGYTRVFYEDLQPDPSHPTEFLPQKALDMQDRKIYLKGYMQPRRQQTGIKEFILCPSTGDCPFCIPDPRPTEKVRVILQGDLTTSYTTREIGVGGRFRVDANDPTGVPYSIEADLLR